MELVEYEQPTISFAENNGTIFDPNAENVYDYGESIPVPALMYSWMGADGGFMEAYYGETIMHPLRIKFFEVEADGSYSYMPMSTINLNECSVSMSYEKLAIVYELTNVYGERYYYEGDI